MFLFLYIDADSCGFRFVAALLRLGFEVLVGTKDGRANISDPEHLELALKQGWPIVTANYKDFAPLHKAWAELGRAHPGIIIWTQNRESPEQPATALTPSAARALKSSCATRSSGCEGHGSPLAQAALTRRSLRRTATLNV